MRCPKSSANYTCLLRRLHADCSSHLDSWHGQQELSNRCRPEQRRLRDVAVSLEHLDNVCMQGCALPTSTPHINGKRPPAHRCMASWSVAYQRSSSTADRPLLLDGQHSISHRRPAHARAVINSSPVLCNATVGLKEFQLTMHRMKTTDLGYIDRPKTLKSTAKWTFCTCQTSLGVVTSRRKPTRLSCLHLPLRQSRRQQ